MTRYREDLDCPVVFAEQDGRDTLAEVLAAHGRRASSTSPRPRSTRTSRTSSTAAASRSGRARSGSSSRRRATSAATTRSRRCRPPRSPSAVAAEIGERLRLRDRQLREPGHGRPHRLIPAVGRGGRDRGRLPRRGRRRRRRARRRRARHRRPRECGDDARAGRRQPAYRAHDEPRPADRHRPRSALRDGGELSDLAPTCLALLGIRATREMTGHSLVNRLA